MKFPTFEYGELRTQGSNIGWQFAKGEKVTNFQEPMMHKVMDILGAKGWECLFISNNMLHAYFKKTIRAKTPIVSGED